MRKNIVNKFLALGFLITTFLIMITISSIYPIVYEVIEENRLWNNFESIEVDFMGSEITHKELIDQLENEGINNYFGLPLIYMNEFGKQGLTENVVFPISEGFKIKNFMNIDGDFSEDDLEGKTKSAIIGENLNKNTIEINGKKYIELYGENFEVIGTIKDTKAFNNFTIVPIKALRIIHSKQSKIGIGVGKNKIDEFLEVNRKMGYRVSINKIKKGSFVEEILKKPTEIKDRIMQIILGIINISMFSYFYTKMVKRDLAIMRVLGADNKYIFKELFSRVIKIAGVGTGGGIILTQLAIAFFRETNPTGYGSLTLDVIMTTAILIIFLSLTISLVSVFSIAKFKVLKEIK